MDDKEAASQNSSFLISAGDTARAAQSDTVRGPRMSQKQEIITDRSAQKTARNERSGEFSNGE